MSCLVLSCLVYNTPLRKLKWPWNPKSLSQCWKISFPYSKFGFAFVVVHVIQVKAIVGIISKIWISWRKQRVKDYEILISNKINIVVKKKSLTNSLKLAIVQQIQNCIRNWEWRRLVKTASVLNKLNLAGERRRQTQAFVDLTAASPSKSLVLKLPIILNRRQSNNCRK